MVWHTLFRSRSLVVVHTKLIAITYLIADHDLDRLLDRDRLADRESHSVAHTLPIAIACRGPHQRMVWHTLFRSRSLVVVHTNLIAITYLIADHDIDRLLDRDRLADRESHSVAHTLPIAIACRGPHQPDRDNIPDRRS